MWYTTSTCFVPAKKPNSFCWYIVYLFQTIIKLYITDPLKYLFWFENLLHRLVKCHFSKIIFPFYLILFKSLTFKQLLSRKWTLSQQKSGQKGTRKHFPKIVQGMFWFSRTFISEESTRCLCWFAEMVTHWKTFSYHKP